MYDLLRCPPFTYHAFHSSLPSQVVFECAVFPFWPFPSEGTGPRPSPSYLAFSALPLPSPASFWCSRETTAAGGRWPRRDRGRLALRGRRTPKWSSGTVQSVEDLSFLHTNLCNACIVDVDAHRFCFFLFYSEGSGNLWCIFFYFPVTVLFVFLPSPFPNPCLSKDP